MVIKRIVQLFIAAIGVTIGWEFGPHLFEWIGLTQPPFTRVWFSALLGGAVFIVCTLWIVDYFVSLFKWFEDKLFKTPILDIASGVLGMIIGLIIAYLIAPSIEKIPVVGSIVQEFISVLFAIIGFRISFSKREELSQLFQSRGSAKDKKSVRPTEHKILDTSVIIDGRIADIVKTGFIEGTLVIPSFVLEELQHIADSSDVLKRNRGRRGLDILNRIQKDLNNVLVQILEIDFEDLQEVDTKLVRLAKQMGGKIVTNDFNLNKVCELQDVFVLNINDLANAVKPVVLPGEEIVVQVIKDGKEYGQGVGYLDDGTMIVVEGGRDFIGNPIEIIVTSVLQTSAGRMIFAKPKLLEKAL